MSNLATRRKLDELSKDLTSISDVVLLDYSAAKGNYTMFERLRDKSSQFHELYYNSLFSTASKTYKDIIIDKNTQKELDRYKSKSDKLFSVLDGMAEQRAKNLTGEIIDAVSGEIPTGLTKHAIEEKIKDVFRDEEKKVDKYLSQRTGPLENSMLLWDGEISGNKRYTIATSGNNTCDKCTAYDGEELLISGAVPGVNVPPFHPNCNCKVKISKAVGTHSGGGRHRDEISGKMSLSYKDDLYAEIDKQIKADFKWYQ